MEMNKTNDYIKYLIVLLILSGVALIGFGFITATIEIIKNIFG